MPVYSSGGSTTPLVGSLTPPGFAAPLDIAHIVASLAPGSNIVVANRVVIPKAGTLSGFFVFVSTSSGNIRGAVYDTGQASSTVRTRLWDGGSTASAANWLSLGAPNITVTEGQHVDFAVMADNATAAFGRTAVLSGVGNLPGGYGSLVNAKFGWTNSPGSFATPSSVAEASATVIHVAYAIVGIIT